jgi:predicted enzyme involved in methoxymalonyl-ACP biosynthesis
MWGGIIGDDGIENIQIGSLGIGKAFTEFQYWAKKLKERGVILAICSKNTESVAKTPFEEHPDMVLRLDDIAVFIANSTLSVPEFVKNTFSSLVALEKSCASFSAALF